MNLSQLKSKTPRKYAKRVGRGGKRGTFSGGGSKGQKSRAGAGVKAGFRGGDNRIWQAFPKQKGSTHKHGGAGNNRIHAKHRYFQLRHDKVKILNLDFFNKFDDGQEVSPELFFKKEVKILGEGELKKKLEFKGFKLSKSAQEKIIKSGSKINE
jgi:large subunit ribosomal protein L15